MITKAHNNNNDDTTPVYHSNTDQEESENSTIQWLIWLSGCLSLEVVEQPGGLGVYEPAGGGVGVAGHTQGRGFARPADVEHDRLQ